MNDPQTGHFNTDIPVTRFDIEKTEVVYGPLSEYGSSGMGGAVNFKSLPPSDKFGIKGAFELGQYDYYSGGLRADLPYGIFKNKISVESAKSGGYMPETEFDRLSANVNTTIDLEDGKMGFTYAELVKNFGADSFYSDIYPNEEEHTNTRFLKLDAEYEREDISLYPILYYRRHWDKFILDRNREDWNKNIHKNYTYGVALNAVLDNKSGQSFYGMDIAEEKICSTSLGKHSRVRDGYFFKSNFDMGKYFFELGMRMDHYSTFGFEFNPSAGASYSPYDDIKLRASCARSFRAPSFTELYYTSPANIGDPELKPENAWTFDAGADYAGHVFDAGVTPFVRFAEDMIDWARTDSSKIWYARNIGKFYVYGIESYSKLLPGKIGMKNIKNAAFKYGYQEAFYKEGFTSKYIFNYLKHNITMNAECEWIYGITQDLSVSFRKRAGDKGYFLLGTKIYKDIEVKKAKIRYYLQAENMTDTEYSDVGGVEQPGFWLTCGISLEF